MNNLLPTGKAGNALSILTAAASKKLDANKGKMIFGFDATASRGPTWSMAQELQRKMFAAVRRLDVQLAVFRGTELIVSTWEDDPAKLEALMGEIDVEGGNTQIERLLQHIVDENAKDAKRGVNAFVFIGDTFEERAGEHRVKALCRALGDLKIPGFFFLEGNPEWNGAYVGAIFKEMAKLTGGAFAAFDANAAETLADLLSSVAAYASGGLAALESRDSKAAKLLLTQMKK